MRVLLIDIPVPELLRRGKLAWFQQGDEVVEIVQGILNRGRREKQKILARGSVDRPSHAFVRGIAQLMRFIDDKHVPLHGAGESEMLVVLEGMEGGDNGGVLCPKTLGVCPEGELIGGDGPQVEFR